MSGRHSRNKGAAAEREVLRLLGDELGHVLARNLLQSRDGGADCLQVVGWAIEVKRCERLSRPRWWAQAVAQAEREGCRPMLLYRRSREPWVAWWADAGGVRRGSLAEAAGAIREVWFESEAVGHSEHGGSNG